MSHAPSLGLRPRNSVTGLNRNRSWSVIFVPVVWTREFVPISYFLSFEPGAGDAPCECARYCRRARKTRSNITDPPSSFSTTTPPNREGCDPHTPAWFRTIRCIDYVFRFVQKARRELSADTANSSSAEIAPEPTGLKISYLAGLILRLFLNCAFYGIEPNSPAI